MIGLSFEVLFPELRVHRVRASRRALSSAARRATPRTASSASRMRTMTNYLVRGCAHSTPLNCGVREKKKPALRRVSVLAGGLGFEPRLTESESVVLPLDDPPKTGRLRAILAKSISASRTAVPRRALRRPTFLRSTSRASRVTKPALRSGLRSASSYSISARVMPWRIAPAWPVMPPPVDRDLDVELVGELHELERLAHDHAAGLAAEELVERTLVDGDLAVARLAGTRGRRRSCGGRCRSSALRCCGH